MKLNVLIVFLTIQVTTFLHSQQVPVSDAEKVARNFYYERINQYETLRMDEIKILNYQEVMSGNSPVYYVFNFDPHGYVIVSASKNTIPVPAYSLFSSCAGSSPPPQFTAWVKQYYDQIVFAMDNPISPLPKVISEWNRLLTEEPSQLMSLKNEKDVAPMLISTWNQGNFYNQMCPADPAGPGGHCLTGCVATAMGQLCYYFRYPVTGSGEYTYQHPDYGTITASFEETEYLWNEMTNSVQSQNNAVAELLFHLGVSVDMDYGPDGSGMWNHKAAYSLRTHFKYSPETQYLYRDSTNLDWDSVVVAHLDRKIPMYYAGWSVPNINGHAFIVDGYQTEDYFHFNWGWGGSYDGYFYLDNLIPGGNNFNLAQELVINCYPDTLNFSYPEFCSNSDTLIALKGTIDDGSSSTHDYLNNSTCSWLISPQTNEDSVTKIILQFARFETEEGHDIVTIYDGETTMSPLLGQFSGATIPGTITTTGNKALITFLSDETITAPGWFISYSSVIPVWCVGLMQLTLPEDSLNDGSGHFNYHNGSACMWNIQPPGASDVTLYFDEFDTEEQADMVKIYDAGTNELLAVYSGTYEPGNMPEPVTSASGKMFITFASNGTITKTGWSAHYGSDSIGTGMDMYSTAQFSIYPNPANDFLFMELNLHQPQVVELTIIDIEGRQVARDTFDGKGGRLHRKLDISAIEKGIYIVRIVASDQVQIQKIVKVIN